MCSYFCRQGMQGNRRDHDDKIGASVTGRGRMSITGGKMVSSNCRQPPTSDSPSFLTSTEGLRLNAGFADTSSQFGDALLREVGDTMFFGTPEPVEGSPGSSGTTVAGGGDDSTTKLIEEKVLGNNEIPRGLQVSLLTGKVSSMVSPKGASPVLASNSENANGSSTGCPLDQEGRRISSPRIPGFKRRKDPAKKKVVCIRAQAAAGSRPSGEVVPSDLWAWRKYGQKPIKGSPYPRGYYRCSSSKGCSARKQVERSQTDPNMLVITYTSEHNHPWPTQRNALAGSRRFLPTKNSASATKSSPRCQSPPATVKEEHKEAPSAASSTAPPVKEQAPEMEMNTTGVRGDYELDHASCSRSYELPPESSQYSDDFFAELGELKSDMMGNLVFSMEFLEDKPDGRSRGNNTMDPFSSFDWVANSFEDAVKRSGL